MPLHLSDSSEAVKRRSLDLSRRWKHHYLSCEHIFLACCIEDHACEEWLSGRGFSIDDFEEHILDLVPSGDDKPIWDGIPESPRLRRVLAKLAQAEAEESRAHRVEPIHMLRAVIKEGRGIPCRVLREVNPSGSSASAAAPESRGGAPLRSQGAGGGRAAQDEVGGSGERRDTGSETKKGKTPFLDKYGRDIVQMVADGKVDPIIGRTDEIRRVVQILARKTKSNPVLIGEAGVGKTAVAFGLARRIYEDKVPDALKNKRVLELALSSMVAGAKHRGEFEERLEGVVKETMAADDIILFIDEIHQLVGAGDSRGGMDASNILKPALARGELTVLGATTTDEFRKYIEKDPALERRFQPVLVGEPSEEEALEMLTGLRRRFEIHHGVKFSDAALAAAISLSVRYVPDRNLPDKAIDLIDEAAARVKTRSGVFAMDAHGRAVMEVGEDIIAEVVADWTGIPVQRMSEQETTRLLRMEQELEGRVVGQDHALQAVAQAIRVVRVGLVAPNRPCGVFLFLGPSGVGKTELAKAMADFLFGDPAEMVRLDMSEYHDKHSVSRLIGSPPGYVGHDEEGQLTRAVRTKPYCVVLLDEVEKAHPEIFDLFLQVFDDGRLTDSKGRTVNFTNTIIIMTSNLGARELLDAKLPNKGYAGQLDTLPQQYQNALKGHFRPEFLNRVDEIIAFRALERSDLYGIAEIHLNNLKKNLEKSRKIRLELTTEAVELILEHGYQPQFGARPLQRAIATYLSRPLAEYMLRNPLLEGSALLAEREGERLVFGPLGATLSEVPRPAPGPSDEPPGPSDEPPGPLRPPAGRPAPTSPRPEPDGPPEGPSRYERRGEAPPPMRRIELEPDPFGDEEGGRPRDVDHFPPPGPARPSRLQERRQESESEQPARRSPSQDPFQTGISGGSTIPRSSSPEPFQRRPSLSPQAPPPSALRPQAPSPTPPRPQPSGDSSQGPPPPRQGQAFSPLRSPKPGDPKP
jgi:ATP-dependent Clp protease ATP-binding subunit ClpC